MNPVSQLMEELAINPNRFRATGGYQRLLAFLREGNAPDAMKKVLGADSEIAGDLLWTVVQLEDVAPFVSAAERHLSSRDKGTAAYAMEIMLRGSQNPDQLLAVLERLQSCDAVVCEHAVRTLAGEGLTRLTEILEAVGGRWRALAKELSNGVIRREVIESLIADTTRDRQVIGLALVTLACEQDRSFADYLMASGETWIREYGKWLMDE